MANVIPARPRANDPEVIKAAVESILQDVISWLNDAGDHNVDKDEVVADLCHAVCGNHDGYEIARELESRSYWEPDSDLVTILDGFSTYSTYQKAVADWAKLWAITSDWKPGDRAVWKNRPGEVREVNKETTQITFLPDDERHKSAAEHPDGLGLHGYQCFGDEISPEAAA